MFCDGGMLSNFPIDLFHSVGVPAIPTLGIQLEPDRYQADEEIDTPIELMSAMNNASRSERTLLQLHTRSCMHPCREGTDSCSTSQMLAGSLQS
jgi:hypothetical protein